MNNDLTNVIGWVIAAASACTLIALSVSAHLYSKRLEQFRANLRPGDVCRVKFSGEYFNARIVSRNSNNYTVLMTHTRKKALLPVSVIYMP